MEPRDLVIPPLPIDLALLGPTVADSARLRERHVLPFVVDAMVLIEDALHRTAAYLPTARPGQGVVPWPKPSALSHLMALHAIRVYGKPDLLEEVAERLPEVAAKSGRDPGSALALIAAEYAPQMRLVDPFGIALPDTEDLLEQVAAIDVDDEPTNDGRTGLDEQTLPSGQSGRRLVQRDGECGIRTVARRLRESEGYPQLQETLPPSIVAAGHKRAIVESGRDNDLSGLRLGRAIERDLVGVAVDSLSRYLDRQLPAGRAAIIADDAAEVEVRFGILEARALSSGQPDAYIVLREYRIDEAPNRPSMYWYGLAERTESSEWLYEAYHLHDEERGGVVPHFQVEIRTVDNLLRRYERSDLREPSHVIPAVENLMTRYYRRQVDREEEGAAR